MLKKILSILLCFSMICGYVTIANARGADTFPFEDKIEIMKALGMINREYDELTIDEEKVLTKSEYMFLAANVLARGEKSDALYFHDLPRENWVSEYVAVLVEKGLVKVNADKYFYPENEMTLEQAYEISLRALGYASLLEKQEAVSLAQTVGINSGVSYAKGITFKNAVLILYNTLFSEIMEYAGSSYVKSDETYIENEYSIIFEEGVVESHEGVSVSSEYDSKYTYISGKEFVYSDVSLYELLGCEVVYLYEYDENNDTRRVLWAKKSKEDDEEIKLYYRENEVSFNPSTYRISYLDGNRHKYIALNKNIDVVYNDEYVVSGIEQILSEEFYYLKLIERDGEYKCLIIRDYDNINVGGIDSVAECIYDKYTNKRLDLHGVDDLKITSKEGKELAFEEIKTDDVLSVYKSLSGDKIEIIVSTVKVEGAVTSIGDDEFGFKYYTVNGVSYSQAELTDADSYILGSTIVLYIDAYGFVSCTESSSKTDVLAYIVKLYYDEGEDVVSLKLYDRSGRFVRLNCAAKLVINSDTYKSASKAKAKLESYGNGLIMYKLNEEGSIKDIQLAANDGTSGLRLRFQKESLRYRSTGNRLGQKMCLDNNTMIWGIPADVKNATEEDFTITTKASLYGDMNYIVESYAVTENVGYEQILLVYENDWNYKHGNTVGVLVTKLGKCVNDNGEVVDTIIGWQGTQQVEKICDESFSVSAEEIEKGDYIITVENPKGAVVDASVKYDLSTGRRPKAKDMHVIEALSSGYVNDVNGNVATVGIESGSDFDMAYDFAAGAVLIYDSAHNEVKVGSVKDLLSYKVSGSDCDFIVVHMRYSKQIAYVIYR